jgi:hypothetical protein
MLTVCSNAKILSKFFLKDFSDCQKGHSFVSGICSDIRFKTYGTAGENQF